MNLNGKFRSRWAVKQDQASQRLGFFSNQGRGVFCNTDFYCIIIFAFIHFEYSKIELPWVRHLQLEIKKKSFSCSYHCSNIVRVYHWGAKYPWSEMWKWGCRDISGFYMWGRRGYLGGVGLQSPDSKQGSRNIWGGRGRLTKCHALSIQLYHKNSDMFTLTHGKINISHKCCGMWILDITVWLSLPAEILSPWGAVARRALLDDNINN